MRASFFSAAVLSYVMLGELSLAVSLETATQVYTSLDEQFVDQTAWNELY